jgi:RNA polymerase sigma-70 factor (ECF subfamily)
MARPHSSPASRRLTIPAQGLTELYEQHRSSLVGYLYRLLGQRELAEDLSQETFLRAWQRWNRPAPPEEARAWLYRVATNLAYDELRRRRRRPGERLPADELLESDTARSQLQQVDDRDLVARLLGTLRPDVAALLVGQFAQDQTLHELARRFGRPEGTVKSTISRARARLRLTFEPLI